MAASDYTGKEKTSLSNIKEMVANATSLEEIRGNMGLGYTLGVLQAANGGTGVNTLEDVANIIADAIRSLSGQSYVPSTILVTGKTSGSRSDDSLHPDMTVNVSPVCTVSQGVEGISISGGAVILTKPGFYFITCKLGCTFSMRGLSLGDYSSSANWSVTGENIKKEDKTTDLGTVTVVSGSSTSSAGTINNTGTLVVAKSGYSDSKLIFVNNNHVTGDASRGGSVSHSMSVNGTLSIMYNDGLSGA